ncbi:hypothetical protein EB151_12655, partial [archaeon]|nr:hypothetical protein [archaeon]
MYQISSEEIYNSSNKIRIVTSTSLFDGHDASINIMRRVLQETGAEIIHLGHNRSVEDIVKTAIQEDAQGIAISSYQGGHIEFFKYMRDLLNKNGYSHIKIFGGGGGVIIPNEIKELHDYGITKIFSPDDGRKMGLQGMINLIMKECDFNPLNFEVQNQSSDNYELWSKTARLITKIENNLPLDSIEKSLQNTNAPPVILGITGTGGAGKSSLTDELLRRFSNNYPDYLFAVISIDPSKRKTGGALLADRIRMNTLSHKNNIYMRSLATRKSNTSISGSLTDILSFLKSFSYNLIIIETSGIGQSGSEIVDLSDHSIYVMTSEYGAASQLEKIDMIDFADLIAINKFERKGSTDALRDVRKQYRRSRKLFDQELISDENLPIYGTIA